MPLSLVFAGGIAMHDYWFDTLNKALVRDTPRRTLLAAAAAGLGVIALPDAGLGKKGKNGKHGKKGHKDKKNDRKNDRKKGNPPSDPAQTCSRGACAAVPEWGGNQGQIDFCETKC